MSQPLTTALLSTMPMERRRAVLLTSIGWLMERHPGLLLYEGVNGRPYTDQEQRAIGLETGLVEMLPCPFRGSASCTINGLGPHYNQLKERNRGPFLFLPTAIAKMLAPNELRALIQQRVIADAKAMVMSRNVNLPTKEMLVV